MIWFIILAAGAVVLIAAPALLVGKLAEYVCTSARTTERGFLMERKFKIGERIVRDNDGQTGTVTNTDFYRPSSSPEAPFWVRIKWDASGSKSDRLEDGLSLLPEKV